MAIDGKPVGQIAETLAANDTKQQNLAELSSEIQRKYAEMLGLNAEQGLKKFPSLNFFIVVSETKDPMIENLWKHKFKVLGMCPRPNYGQHVYRFNQETGNLEHLWAIPDRNLCLAMIHDKALVDIKEYPLLENVLRFADGTLAKWREAFNSEQEELALKLAGEDHSVIGASAAVDI